MRSFVVAGLTMLAAVGCQTTTRTTEGAGYVGIAEIEILAKGME